MNKEMNVIVALVIVMFVGVLLVMIKAYGAGFALVLAGGFVLWAMTKGKGR